MHHGHSVPSTKMLCPISQMTKANARATPASNSHQNHRAKRAPARIATPTTIGATQPVSPRIGLGKPNTLPCQDSRFLPHWTSGLMSQPRIASGFSSRCSRSIVSENAAHHPIAPAMMSHTARAVGRVRVTGCVMPRIMASRAERMPRSEAVESDRGASPAHSRDESAIMVNDASRPRRPSVTQKTSGDERPSQPEPRAGCRPSE